MIYDVIVGERNHRVSVRGNRRTGWYVAIDGGAEVHYTGESVGAAEWILREEGRARAIGVRTVRDDAFVQVGGYPIHARVVDPRRAALDLAGGASEGAVATSMPGVVVRVVAEVGAVVRKGDVVLVVEAMKMENEFKAPCDGTVEAIYVGAGQAVEANTVMAIIGT